MSSQTTIAGIRIPDSALARDARDLAREHSPEFLLAHVDRTFVFGALATAGAGLHVDEELGYVAAILHDLGLTEAFGGERRFEIDGAEAARIWARSQGMSADEAQDLWDAIALHTSAGIAGVRSPLCGLVHWGAGLDVLGFGADQFDPALIDAVHTAFPRDGFSDGLAVVLEAAARRAPAAYAMTWMAPLVNQCCGVELPNLTSTWPPRDPFAAVAG